MTEGLRLGRRQGHCGACARRFAEGEEVFSLLRVAEGGLARRDLCPACFDHRDASEEAFFWRTRHRSERAGTLRVDFDLLLGVAEKLAADARPECRDFCFLVGLLLVRHRRLRLGGIARHDGAEWMRVRRVRSHRSFEIEVRDLSPQRRARLTALLAQAFDPARETELEALLAAAGEDEWASVPREGGSQPGPLAGEGQGPGRSPSTKLQNGSP